MPAQPALPAQPKPAQPKPAQPKHTAAPPSQKTLQGEFEELAMKEPSLKRAIKKPETIKKDPRLRARVMPYVNDLPKIREWLQKED